MQLLKGKPVADTIADQIISKVDQLHAEDVQPTLAILRVGQNDSDVAYETSAVKKAESLGLQVKKFVLEEDISETELIDALEHINQNEEIHGVLLFRPLPAHIDEERVRNYLVPQKDIDGISDSSLAGIFTGEKTGFPPCTAEAVMKILQHYNITLSGKKVVVIGRSLVIGKPVAMMLLHENATVTICHSRTGEEALKQYCRQADIIICATGRAKMINADYVNGRQMIVDVGINFDEEGRMCGDADQESIEASNGAAALTPVPGGVGNVTTALLLHHVVEAAEMQRQKEK